MRQTYGLRYAREKFTCCHCFCYRLAVVSSLIKYIRCLFHCWCTNFAWPRRTFRRVNVSGWQWANRKQTDSYYMDHTQNKISICFDALNILQKPQLSNAKRKQKNSRHTMRQQTKLHTIKENWRKEQLTRITHNTYTANTQSGNVTNKTNERNASNG